MLCSISCLVPACVSTRRLSTCRLRLAAAEMIAEDNSQCSLLLLFKQHKRNQSLQQLCLKLATLNRKYFWLFETTQSGRFHEFSICRNVCFSAVLANVILQNKTCSFGLPARFMCTSPCCDMANYCIPWRHLFGNALFIKFS